MYGIIVDIKNGIKEPIHGYQNCNVSQILISGGNLKVRKFVDTHLLFGSIPFT